MNNQPWTSEEVKFLQENISMSVREKAVRLGRSYKSVEHKVRDLKTVGRLPSNETAMTVTNGVTVKSYIEMLSELVRKDYRIKRYPDYNFKVKDKSKEILNLIISDKHVGKVNTWYDTKLNKKLVTYDDSVRKKFNEKYLESVVRLLSLWQHGYFFEKLNILLLGDVLDNDRIFPGQKTCISMPVGQQMWEAVAELADMILQLTSYFPQVEIVGITGNHGRSVLTSEEEEPVENNFEYHMYKILKLMLQENKKIIVTIPESRFYSIMNYDYKIFMSHGDTIRGYTISYAERKAKELLINLPEGYNLYCIGHRHRSDRIALSPTAELLVNGCWIPYDDYAFKLYGTSTQPSQWCFGSSPHRVISSLCVPIDFKGA